MKYKIPKRITTLYTILLTTALLLLPLAGVAAPQHTDINKPTRERVKKDKQQDNKKANATNKNDGNTSGKKADVKPAATPKKEEAVKPAAGPKKEDDKTLKAEPAKQPANDTAKAAAPPKPKAPTTINPASVQFDGIDISKHQGDINWEELKKNQSIKFIYIKATEGSDFVDPRYHENIRNARKHGFKVGSYHFLSTRSAATTQFYNFIRNAKREDQDLIPIIDIERLSPWNSQQLRDSVKVFADLIEDYYGCKPLLYTSEKFFTSNLGRAFAHYPLFIAKYSSNQPNIGYKWILWQFSDCGYFKAVKGNYGEVDLSRFNKGCTIKDIMYNPSKAKPKSSVRDAVDHKEKPSQVNMKEEKPKPTPTQSKKQQEEAKKKAEKEKKDKERNKKMKEDEAKKKAEAEKKEAEKKERIKKEQQRQKAREDAAKKEADAKAKRKAEAQKAKQQKAQNKASKPKKSASFTQNNNSKLSQSQRNDSIRNAQQQCRKTNKSSADND